MAIGEFTLRQLEDGCRIGMLDSFGQQLYRPDFKTTFLDMKDELDYVIVNRHQFNSIGARYLHFKRDEIKTGIYKDAIPYSTRLGTICDEEVFIIQQLDFDNMSAKIVGMPNSIKIIKDQIRDNTTFEGMTDDEFWEAHRRDLDAYRNIPGLNGLASLSLERSRFVQGAYNMTPEILDEQGLHKTQLQDYDNYLYTIYNTSRESYYRAIYIEQKEKRNEDKAIYYEEKLDTWKECVDSNVSRIYKILTTKTEFVDEIRIYNFQDGSKLHDDGIMTDLCKKHHVSYKGGWATWKALNIDNLENYIESGEYMESHNDIPYIFTSNNKASIQRRRK